MWNLSKLMTNTFVNFGNFFNSMTLSPQEKKYLQKTLFGRNGQFLSAWGIMKKPGEEFCLEAWVKLDRCNFLTHKCICSNLNTINLKLFCNYGGIYRFRKKFKKDSWEINLLGAHRNMRGCILEINCEGLGC